MRSRTAVLCSVGAHGVAALVAGAWLGFRPVRREPAERPPELFETALVTLPSAPVPLAVEAPPAPGEPPPPATEPPAVVAGPADVWSADPASPNPRADVNTPDPRPTSRGGGGTGATEAWTGRHDPGEVRTQPWNDPDTYRLARHRTGDAASPVSTPRVSDPGWDARTAERRRPARDGAAEARSAGAPATLGADWDDLDPRWDDGGPVPGTPGATPAPAGARSEARLAEDGAIVVRSGRVHVDVGSDTPDAIESTQASDETHPGPIEMTRPRAGGVGGEGVAGRAPGDGLSAQSSRPGDGAGGTPADLPRRAGGVPSSRAREQDAYFRRLSKQVLDRVVFPPRLAVALEQGEVVVAITLRRDGSVLAVRVDRSSGFREFDEAVVRAVKLAGPYGRVPEAIARGREQVVLKAPFVFDNPLIR